MGEAQVRRWLDFPRLLYENLTQPSPSPVRPGRGFFAFSDGTTPQEKSMFNIDKSRKSEYTKCSHDLSRNFRYTYTIARKTPSKGGKQLPRPFGRRRLPSSQVCPVGRAFFCFMEHSHTKPANTSPHQFTGPRKSLKPCKIHFPTKSGTTRKKAANGLLRA